MGRAQLTLTISNVVERSGIVAELFAFNLRVNAGNTDAITDEVENFRQKLLSEVAK